MHTPESEDAWGLKETRLTTKSVKIGSALLTSKLGRIDIELKTEDIAPTVFISSYCKRRVFKGLF